MDNRLLKSKIYSSNFFLHCSCSEIINQPPFSGKFYCQTHFGMQRVERPKYTRHVLRSTTDGSVPTNGAASPTRQQLDVAAGLGANRGLTPERAEFENSYAEMTSEDEPNELDEDEWTERNFGSSFEQDTSDDDYSDLRYVHSR